MVQLVLIGIGAGAATALLFASIASGSIISVLLFYLAPLPILIAALGWSHWAALIAAVTASAALAAVFGTLFFIAFLLGVGLPAWWLGYLALLARPATKPTRDGLEWYPIGHLIVWAAIVSALIVIAAMLALGTDEENFRASLRRGIERLLRVQSRSPAPIPGVPEPDRLVDFLVAVLPPVAAMLTTTTSVINLGLAGRVVSVSGRLRRPWPEVSAMQFPTYAPLLTGAAVAASFLPGLPGVTATVFAAAILTAYTFLGLAVLHAVTRGVKGRPFVLGGAYAAVIVFFWPALALTLLGLGDAAFDIRGRVARKRGPPSIGT